MWNARKSNLNVCFYLMRLDYEILTVGPFGNFRINLCSLYLYSVLMRTFCFIRKYSSI